MCLWKPENHPQNRSKSADVSQIEGSRYPCSCAGSRTRPRRRARPRLEQRTCPCGGRDGRLPSRKPSQPAQAPTSAAAPPAKSGPPSHRIGEVRSPSVVCVCVSGSVGRVRSCGRSSPVLVVWGGSPAPGWLMFSISPAKEKNLCRRFFRVRLPIWGPVVRVPVGMSPPSSIPSFAMFRCLRRRRPGSRATCNRFGVYAHFWWLITRASSGCAVRVFFVCCGGVF